MFIPLTSEQIEGAVKGAIEGGAEVSARAVRGFFKNRKLKKWIRNVVTIQLNQMFANRRFAWRDVQTLARAFDEDKAPFTLTRETLRGLFPEVRRSVLDQPRWIKEDNWVWVIDEKGRREVAKDNNGLYILQEGVPEGHI